MDDDRDYDNTQDDLDNEVGYCKPPKHSQFKKGHSGNPKGRPKKDQTVPETFRRIGKQKVRVNGKHGPEFITKFEASVTQLFNKAATGDVRAMQILLKIMKDCPSLVTEPDPPVNFVVNFVDPKTRKQLPGILDRKKDATPPDNGVGTKGFGEESPIIDDEWWKH